MVAITPIAATALAASLPEQLGERSTIHIVELPRDRATVAGVVDVVRGIGRPDAVLFGHSMNGTLALAAAAEVPCAGVVAVGAPPRLPIDAEVRRAYWEANAEPERRRRAAAPDADHDRLQRWYDLDVEPSDIDAPAVTDLDMRWIQGIFEDAATLDWDATMRAVSCPVLLALGEYDFLVPPTLWTDAVRPARTTVEVFSRSGHTPFVEQPDEFLAAFDRWVAAGAQ